MLNNILLRLLGMPNTVIDGPTIQFCEVSEHVLYLRDINITIIEYRYLEVTFLYSELQR